MNKQWILKWLIHRVKQFKISIGMASQLKIKTEMNHLVTEKAQNRKGSKNHQKGSVSSKEKGNQMQLLGKL